MPDITLPDITLPGITLSEPQIRLVAFGSIFVILALIELRAPRLQRDEVHGALKSHRWFTNLSILILSSILLRVVFPLAAVGTASWVNMNGYGVLPSLNINPILSGFMTVVILDFAIWFEHLLSHKVGLFWRVHRMHHADIGFDVTTALRFHPIEICASMLWKAAIIIILGPPVLAVLIFEVILNGAAMFNHANIMLPLKLDRLLRVIIVTPDMHRIHHSTIENETNSNYGFNLSVWDKLFGTYTDQPSLGHENIVIGLNDWRDREPTRLFWSLKMPFMRK